jgi:hypothetical protein
LTFVDSAAGILGEQELAWIDSDLSETEQPVKIVVLHHPPFDPDGTGHIHAYAQAVRDGTTYVITGRGGAPLHTYARPDAYYHYVQVIVQGEQVETRVVRLK